jgi:hypothetical protein
MTSELPTADGPLLPARTALLSRVFGWFCAVAIIGAVGMAALAARSVWLSPEFDPWSQLALAAALAGAFGTLIWGLHNGRKSFAGLARGELFARRTIAGLRNLAIGILTFKIAMFVVAVCTTLVSRMPANANITFKDLTEGVLTVIALAAVVLIASVLTRAAEIAEDNAQIV